MPTLHITLLGPLTVLLDGTPADFRTDSQRALLACLALNQGIPQRRDSLASLLSPDRGDAEALTYLRNRLTRLRRTLGDQSATPPWFTVDRKQIVPRTGDDIQIDSVTFERRLTAVETHAHRHLAGCPACLTRLQEAVELVRGELLAGLNFPSEPWEAWLLAQREYFRERALAAMMLLSTAQMELGEWEAVLEITGRQLRLEPWLEEAHRARMSAWHQLGDRNAALAQYEQCVQTLWDELGVQPEEATVTLAETIKNHDTSPPAADSQQPAAPHNLPLQTSPFFGRATERDLLIHRLVDPAYRLITLVGTGGIGKTRLAIEVGQQVRTGFPDGVWFVALDGIASGAKNEAEPIQIAIGEACQLGQEGKQLTGDQVLTILRNKQMLLILDNCEAVLEDLAFIPQWLRRAPGVAILATSREPLYLEAESVVMLEGLPIGAGDKGTGEMDAAEALFAERGRMARADFAVSDENLSQVRQICQLVDGLPLGIALAAAWVRRRSLAQIIASINESIDFLSSRLRDVDPRHRSMRAVFETSWALLDADEAAVLAALSVFPASFSAEAAAKVAGASLFELDGLCEKSLLQQQHEAERYTLHSLVRQFAAEKLAEDLVEPMGDLHHAFVDHFYNFARNHRSDYAALQPEWGNLSAAIATAHEGEAWQMVLDFVETVFTPWDQQLRTAEMRSGLTLALDAATHLSDQPATAHTRLRLGQLAYGQSEYETAQRHLDEALGHFMQLEEGREIAQVRYLLGCIHSEQGREEEALRLFEESRRIFEEEEDLPGVARNLNAMAYCAIMGDPTSEKAQAYLEQSVDLLDEEPVTQAYVEALLYLSRMRSEAGDYAQAEAYMVRAASASQEQDDVGIQIMLLFDRTILCRRRKQLDGALRYGTECLEVVQTIGSLRWEALVKTQLGMVHQAKEAYAQALALFQDGLQVFIEQGDQFEQAFSCYRLYDLCAQMGALDESLRYKSQAIQLNRSLQNAWLEERLR